MEFLWLIYFDNMTRISLKMLRFAHNKNAFYNLGAPILYIYDIDSDMLFLLLYGTQSVTTAC